MTRIYILVEAKHRKNKTLLDYRRLNRYIMKVGELNKLIFP